MTQATSTGNRYGRQGGGWVDHAPGTLVRELDALRARMGGDLRTVEARELATKRIAADADLARRHPEYVPGHGSTTWEGMARMAHARHAAGVALSAVDVEAIRRHPTMPGLCGGTTGDPVDVALLQPSKVEDRSTGGDAARARAAADAAIADVDAHADPDWKAAARGAIATIAARRRLFTTDDVHEVLDNLGVTTHEPSALGAVMRRAQADGLIEPTADHRPSTRVECHGRPLRVWASRLAT